MGKSTLAARIVRCLYHEQGIDMILGDSAKSQAVDVISGSVRDLVPSFYNSSTLVERLCAQLGLPFTQGRAGHLQAQRDIRDRLVGRRAIIVVDNLETVRRSDAILKFLRTLTSRDVRILLTTRREEGLSSGPWDAYVVHLNPISTFADARKFLTWHVETYSNAHPDLAMLRSDFDNRKRMQLLVDRTGGVPLLMQLIVSDIARSSWRSIEHLPRLFGPTLLNFLYEARWKELGALSTDGEAGQRVLIWLAGKQRLRQEISFEKLNQWATRNSVTDLDSALRLLFERFLVINSDTQQGCFILFPSFVEFLQVQGLLTDGS